MCGCCAHRWTNNGPDGGSRLLRWDGASINTEKGEGKIRGQFFGGYVLKVEAQKAVDGYVPKAERGGLVAKGGTGGGAEEGAKKAVKAEGVKAERGTETQTGAPRKAVKAVKEEKQTAGPTKPEAAPLPEAAPRPAKKSLKGGKLLTMQACTGRS